MIPPQDGAPSDSFLTTPWSLLFSTRRPGDLSAEDEEFANLCEIYWRPICHFIEKCGCDRRDAREIAQRFLASLLDQKLAAATGPTLHLRPHIFERLNRFLIVESVRRRIAATK